MTKKMWAEFYELLMEQPDPSQTSGVAAEASGVTMKDVGHGTCSGAYLVRTSHEQASPAGEAMIKASPSLPSQTGGLDEHTEVKDSADSASSSKFSSETENAHGMADSSLAFRHLAMSKTQHPTQQPPAPHHQPMACVPSHMTQAAEAPSGVLTRSDIRKFKEMEIQ
ncbi:hypothetical protein ACKKBG_A29245 [Auxenochlorella protothecoides x Auxenochlorella symbiontica]